MLLKDGKAAANVSVNLMEMRPGGVPLNDILCRAAREETRQAVLGFSPVKSAGQRTLPLREENTTLFLLHGKKDPFGGQPMMFPLLSHA